MKWFSAWMMAASYLPLQVAVCPQSSQSPHTVRMWETLLILYSCSFVPLTRDARPLCTSTVWCFHAAHIWLLWRWRGSEQQVRRTQREINTVSIVTQTDLRPCCSVMNNVWKHAARMSKQRWFTFPPPDRWPLQFWLRHETRLDLSLRISVSSFLTTTGNCSFSLCCSLSLRLTFCFVSALVMLLTY